MPFKLTYHPQVVEIDLPVINKNVQIRIKKAIEKRLTTDPLQYGAPLRRSLKGYRKLRVGDYRAIYEIVGGEVRIYAIGHRKEVYESKIREWNS